MATFWNFTISEFNNKLNLENEWHWENYSWICHLTACPHSDFTMFIKHQLRERRSFAEIQNQLKYKVYWDEWDERGNNNDAFYLFATIFSSYARIHIIVPILVMRKLRLRGKELTQCPSRGGYRFTIP
jgi:hypothetical protein